MGRGGAEVPQEEDGLAAGPDLDRVMSGGVAGGVDQRYARDDLLLSFDEPELIRLLERRPVFGPVGDRRPLVPIGRRQVVFPRHDVGGVGKVGRHRLTLPAGVASTVVEMEMGVDDQVDVARLHSKARQAGNDVRLPADTVDVLFLGGVFPSGARVHQDGFMRSADEEAVESETNPVAAVRTQLPFPEDPGHDPEYGASVQADGAVGDVIESEPSQPHSFGWTGAWVSSTRTPPVLRGWMKAMRRPSAPVRGTSSIRSTFRSLSRLRSSRRSSTSKAM